MQRSQSDSVYEALCSHLVSGVNSPVRSCRAVGMTPVVATKGEGPFLWDVDGHKYIDYCLSWGALIHGHAHPKIIEAICHRATLGTSFGVTTAGEGELAALICKHKPSIEKVRMVCSGTEATMSAIRLARGCTGRSKIVKFDGHYHGHSDGLLVQAGSGALGLAMRGVPPSIAQETFCLPFNDEEALRALFAAKGEQIACVIVEPIAGNMGVVPATKSFIASLRQETEKWGALLIFDEVITGFRLGLGGAQTLYGVTPDLTCLGKILGGGLPAAAFGGAREWMEQLAPLGTVYQAGTLAGNPLAVEAGIQALQLLSVPHFYEGLQEKADLLWGPVEAYIKEKKLKACVQRSASMGTLFFGLERVSNGQEAREADKTQFAHFFRFLLEKGIYIPPLQQEPWFLSTAHTDELLCFTSKVIVEFLAKQLA